MAQDPELLLLDEPTTHLDVGWRERIVTTIQQLQVETALTVMLVCHELEVLPSACRRVVLLDHGRVSATGAPECLFTPARIVSLFGVKLPVAHEGGRHAILPGGSLRV